MNSIKKTSNMVGFLFLSTMIAGAVDAYMTAPILKSSLENVYANRVLVKTGAFFALYMSIGIVGIAIVLYPLVKKYNETIAITYVSFRSIEGVLLILMLVCSMLVITVSEEYINSNGANESLLLFVKLIMKFKYLSYQSAMAVLGLGSMFLCYLFYQTRLVPRFLSLWGLIGYVLLFLSAILDMMGIIDTIDGMGALMYVPGGIWEFIAFPLWLFVKGFHVEKS